MQQLLMLSLPLTNPVEIFFLMLLIIFLVPLLLSRLKIPNIVGLIMAGLLVGPHGLNLLHRDAGIVLLGTAGLLYIMFMAGIEIDLHDFKKNRRRSLLFGLLTFSVPILLGSATGYFVMNFQPVSAILFGSMFASHTLLSYPIVSKLNLSKCEAVTVTIGGTIITDTAVLLLLAIISKMSQGQLDLLFWLQLLGSLLAFVFAVFVIIPYISRWFFKNAESELQFVFVLGMVFLAGVLAELAGIEPIIGAFLAGLALNRLIPNNSLLMNRIEFAGNSIFIPFFLISVGMLINLNVLFNGWHTLQTAAIIIAIAVSGKWLAAFILQKITGYSAAERKLVYGLSSAHAAATLAVVLIGFELGLLGEDVLNGAIVLILVSSMNSSFNTQLAGREIALRHPLPAADLHTQDERILVPVANPENISYLVDLAMIIKEAKPAHLVYPLVVVKDDEEAGQRIMAANQALQRYVAEAPGEEQAIRIVSRIDVNASGGIIRASRELMINTIVMGWHGKVRGAARLFGNTLQQVLYKTSQMIFVCKIRYPLNVVENIVVIVPPNAELEKGFKTWMHKIKLISAAIGRGVRFVGNAHSIAAIENTVKNLRFHAEVTYQQSQAWHKLSQVCGKLLSNDLLIAVTSRPGTISYSHQLDDMPGELAQQFEQVSFVVIYPVL